MSVQQPFLRVTDVPLREKVVRHQCILTRGLTSDWGNTTGLYGHRMNLRVNEKLPAAVM